MVRGTADPSAALGMTKERATLRLRVVALVAACLRMPFVPLLTWSRQVRLLGMTKGRATLP
jgi:hypothetical protein